MEVKDAAHSKSYKNLPLLSRSRARTSLPADDLGRRNSMTSFVPRHERTPWSSGSHCLSRCKLEAKLEITCSIPQIHQSRLTECD